MREAEVMPMTITTLVILLITVFLLGYLVVALLYPEKF
jgi:K+-transporting ATPase KdpF subunit